MDYFTHVTALAAIGVVIVQQILKLNAIPVYLANRYPIVTNVVLSAIAAFIATIQTVVQPHVWTEWVVFVATISVVAAVIYNMTLKNSEAVQKASDKKGP